MKKTPARSQKNAMPNTISRAEKRKSQEKEEKKRKTRKAIVSFLAILIVLVASVSAFFFLFEVKDIKLSGESGPYKEDEIVESSGLKAGDNLFLSNIELAQEMIEEKLPYIGQAEIKRKLLGSFVIKVNPTKDFAYVKAGEYKYFAINEEGKVLDYLAQPSSDDLPLVLCNALSEQTKGKSLVFDEEKDPEDLDLYILKELLVALAASELENISQIDIRASENLTVLYKDSLLLRLGNVSGLERKFKAAHQAIKEREKASLTQGGVLDLRNNDKVIFVAGNNE